MIEVTMTALSEEGASVEILQMPFDSCGNPRKDLDAILHSDLYEEWSQRYPEENSLSATIEFNNVKITVTKQSPKEDTGETPNS